MAKVAVFPGSFDPFTLGHLEIVERASALFDTLLIAVTDGNRSKERFLPLKEREKLIQTATATLANIEVVSFAGLLVDFMQSRSIDCLVRSVRHGQDFEYEKQMAQANSILSPELETVFLIPSHKVHAISSSLVREIAANGGDLSPFVPKCVKDTLLNARVV